MLSYMQRLPIDLNDLIYHRSHIHGIKASNNDASRRPAACNPFSQHRYPAAAASRGRHGSVAGARAPGVVLHVDIALEAAIAVHGGLL